jgi:hypothetical protein
VIRKRGGTVVDPAPSPHTVEISPCYPGDNINAQEYFLGSVVIVESMTRKRGEK